MRIEHSLEINAPPDVVWAVTIDVERWPEWTPTMQRVVRLDAGPFQIGSTARVKQPQMAEAIWRVLPMTPGQRFSWGTGRRGLRMVGTHEIIPTATGCTSHLSLDVEGLLGWLLWPLIRRSAAQAVATENSGLRDRCQQLARSGQQNSQQAM